MDRPYPPRAGATTYERKAQLAALQAQLLEQQAQMAAQQAALAALQTQMAAVLADRAPRREGPPGAEGPRAEPRPSRRRLLQRLGASAAGAAVAATALGATRPEAVGTR